MPTGRHEAPLPLLAVPCLSPIEASWSTEADMSARNVHHRSAESFEEMVAATSALLRKTQAPAARPGLQLLSEAPPPLSASATASVSLAPPRSRFVSARLSRAYALHRLRRYAEAVADYSECLQSAPGDAVVWYNRACALYGLARLDDAARDLTKAVKLDSKNALFVESRARVLKELGRFHEAIRDYAWLDSLRRAFAGAPSVGDDDGGGLSHSSSSPLALELDAAVSVAGRRVLLAASACPPSLSPQHVLGPSGRHGASEWLAALLSRGRRTRTAAELQAARQLVGGWRVFRGMDNAMVETCLGEATLRSFGAEQPIVRQGVASKSFFAVLDAPAPFVRAVAGAATSRELRTLCQGDCVGVEPPGATATDGRFLTFRSASPASLGLPRMKSFRSLAGLSMSAESTSSSSSSSSSSSGSVGKPGLDFVPPEPATLSCLGDVSCLVLDVGAYHAVLRAHEQAQHAARLRFLRQCRGFESLPAETLSALAAASGAQLYAPGTDVLRAGDVVTQLWLIQRGVCQVRKAITRAPASAVGRRRGPKPTPGRPHGATSRGGGGSGGGSDSLTARSVDGSWVLDNGWMLTNPRLVTGAQPLEGARKAAAQDVTVAVLASAQLFGELSVLQPGQPSQVTVRAQTLVDTLVFQAADLSELHVQYHSGAMNALQASLLFHNPPQQKIAQLQREHERWGREKRGVLGELFPEALEARTTERRGRSARDGN